MREAKAKDRVAAKKAAGGDQNNVSDLESQYKDEFDSYLERLDEETTTPTILTTR